MVTQFLSFLHFGPHEVPFVAPMLTLLVPAFIALFWFAQDIEKDIERKEAMKKSTLEKKSID
jgi:L-lactate permease